MICCNRFVVPKPKWLPNWILLPCHCVVVLTGVVTHISPVVLKVLAYVNSEKWVGESLLSVGTREYFMF